MELRTFTAYRKTDISATHDSNQLNPPDEPQFEGCVFSDGSVVLRWLTAKRSTSVWQSLDDAMAIHGHPEYGTVIVWHTNVDLSDAQLTALADGGTVEVATKDQTWPSYTTISGNHIDPTMLIAFAKEAHFMKVVEK